MNNLELLKKTEDIMCFLITPQHNGGIENLDPDALYDYLRQIRLYLQSDVH